MVRRSVVSIRALLLTTLIAVASLAAAAPGPAAADGVGPRVRLGHFSPGTPPVDVYLATLGGKQRLVLPALAYGQLSQYTAVSPGRYAFSMRKAGAPATAPKLLSGQADFFGDTSYTLLAFTQNGRTRTKAYIDDNTVPPAGTARFRLIHTASTIGRVNVTVNGGPTLADGLRVGDATQYESVPAGNWPVRIAGTTGPPVDQSLQVSPGTVDTLLVVGDGTGVRLMSVVDATGIGSTTAGALPETGPVGGVATGAGGTARTFVTPSSTDRTPLVIAASGLALAAVAALVLTRRRRAFRI